MSSEPEEATADGSRGGSIATDESAPAEATTDSAQKSYETILEQEIAEGLTEIERPPVGLYLSGLSAGLDIGFGPLLMAVVLSHAGGGIWPLVETLFVATAYALGFVFVILGRSNLFTEHTVLAIFPVLDRRASVVELLRTWSLIYAGNITGCVVFSVLAVLVGPAIDIVDPAAFVEIADTLVAYSWWATLLSAVLAGWLMGLLSWLVVGARDTISAIVIVWAVTGAIGFAHLPHSIAGTVEVLLGVLTDPTISPRDFGGFLLWSTLGNVVGGVVFVALMKYSHVVRGGEEPDDVTV